MNESIVSVVTDPASQEAGKAGGAHFAFDDEDDNHTKGGANRTNLVDHSSIHPSDSLSETLNTEHLDIDSNDHTCWAGMIRCIASGVGFCCTPSRMLVTMRILKAVTFSFLVLTIVADSMYIFFVDIMSTVGDDGLRGMMARFYGIILCVLAILLELDVHRVVVLFPGFKGFIPRALLLFLIAVITNVGQPQVSSSSATESYGQRMLGNNYYKKNKYYNANANKYYAANANANKYYAANANDDNGGANAAEYYAGNQANAKNDDVGAAKYYSQKNNAAPAAVYYDDGADYYDPNNANTYYAPSNDEGFFQNLTPNQIEENVPMSAVIFQIVTSWVLAGCAFCYFIMGIFCCDRFTAKAFMSTRDPVAATVIDSKTPEYKAPELA